MAEQCILSCMSVGFVKTELVWFDIKGAFVGRMMTRADPDDVIGKFFDWMRENKIYSAVASTSGGGMYIGGFYSEDAPKVEAWLREQGCIELEQHETSKQRRIVKQ